MTAETVLLGAFFMGLITVYALAIACAGWLVIHGFYHAGIIGFQCCVCGELVGVDDGPQVTEDGRVACRRCNDRIFSVDWRGIRRAK